MAIVQKYKGLPLSPYPCEDWMEFWCTHSDQWIIWCAETQCKRVALVASLIKILESGNNQVHLVPLCKGHAASDDPISIGEVRPVRVL